LLLLCTVDYYCVTGLDGKKKIARIDFDKRALEIEKAVLLVVVSNSTVLHYSTAAIDRVKAMHAPMLLSRILVIAAKQSSYCSDMEVSSYFAPFTS